MALKGTKHILVQFKGTTPLLMSAMDAETVEDVLIRGNRPTPDKTSPLPVLAAKALYTNGKTDKEGNPLPYIPLDCVYASIRDTGSHFKIPGTKKQLSTAKETRIPIFATFRAVEMTGPRTWVADVRRGRLPTGTACGIVRPKFNKWGFEVLVDIEQDEGVDVELFKKLFAMAGRANGLMAFRPSCKGTFGMYKPISWTELTSHEANVLEDEHTNGNMMHEILAGLREDFVPTPFQLGA